MHDVLGFNASERPGEDDKVERERLDLDLGPQGDAIRNTFRKLGRKRAARPLDRLCIGIERQHARRIGGDADGETAVTAAELQHVLPAEGGEPAQRREVRALRIEDALQPAG